MTSGRFLQSAYTLWAPFYDLLLRATFRESRQRSLAALGDVSGLTILIDGIGTGLDLPFLPRGARYVGVDLTPAMLHRARASAHAIDFPLQLARGDAMALPFPDRAFDRVIMHLILAVVPQAPPALAEAARVVKPGGFIHIFDKFLRPGQRAPVRRLLAPLAGRLATRTDVVFEEVLATRPGLEVVNDEPDLAGGWFRRIVLRRIPPP
jgi:ubiquinone/menaquinone biosynthesis C-methylase UbiE